MLIPRGFKLNSKLIANVLQPNNSDASLENYLQQFAQNKAAEAAEKAASQATSRAETPDNQATGEQSAEQIEGFTSRNRSRSYWINIK